jgi:hypothetical protein
MRNKVSGEIKELEKAEFLELFVKELHGQIERIAQRPGVDAVVCFETAALEVIADRGYGRRAMVVGPECQYQMAHLENARLGDVPSRFQYPKYIWIINPEMKGK